LSLTENIFLYSRTLADYYFSLEETFYSLDEREKTLFSILVEGLIKELPDSESEGLSLPEKERDDKKKKFFLYRNLYSVFITSLIWKKEKCTLFGDRKTAGLYIIFNKISLKTYVAESKNVEKRLFTHYQNLREGGHPNKGLRRDSHLYGIESFFFFVAQYWEEYEDSTFRKDKEIFLMKNWTCSVYNIKDMG